MAQKYPRCYRSSGGGLEARQVHGGQSGLDRETKTDNNTIKKRYRSCGSLNFRQYIHVYVCKYIYILYEHIYLASRG